MSRATPKSSFICVDGPFKGSKLWLSADHKSAVFTVRGQTGRYVGQANHKAAWEAA